MRAYISRMIAVSLLLILALSSGVNAVNAGGFNAGIGGLSWSPDGKSLLYTVFKDGVFVVTPGEDPRRITDTNVFDHEAQWSPDGQSIISTIEVDNQAGIFRTPIAGGEPQRLTEDVGWRPQYYAPNGTHPRLSPDGQSIAFLSLREGDHYTSLYSMSADGEDERALTNVGTVEDFVWSPDSQAIAFIATPDSYVGGSDLFLIDSHGTKLRRLTNTADVDGDYALTWTPDGRHIVFTTAPDDQTEQREIIDMDGQNRKKFGEQLPDSTYSPDGKYSLFKTPAEPWPKFSIQREDGTGSDVVTISLPGKRAYYAAAWSPDSSQIAFVSFLFDAPKSESIYLINADGTNPQTLVSYPIS
jgi:Tol biopolymer transport system component